MGDNEIGKQLDRMRRLCSRREYCRSDILRKLKGTAGIDETAALEIVAKLEEEKYIDDLRYAGAFVRDKSSLTGWGAAKIRFMLSSKGIAKEYIDKALEETDEEKMYSRLEKLMEAKYRTLKDDPQCRLKMLRFALGRGYGYEEVESVYRKLEQKES